MSIVIEEVEGVVQKDSEGATAPASGADSGPPKPAAEVHAHHQRVLEERARRLHAD